MQINCHKQDISRSLNIVSKAVSTKSTIPSLKGILLETTNDGNLKIAASDNDLSIQQFINVDIIEDGRIVVPAKLFIDLIKKLPGESIHLRTDENNNIKVTSGSSDINIVGISADDFPDIPEIENNHAISINKSTFVSMVSMTSFSASLDESKGTATGILLEAEGGKIRMVSIDGYRMSVVRESAENENNDSIIIVARVLNEVSKILSEYSDDDYEIIEIIINDNYASIKLEKTLIVMRILEGKFIEYNNILPKDFKTRVTISKSFIKDSLDRVSLLAKDNKNNLIRMKIEEGIVFISSRSDAGYIKDELPANKEGEDLEIGFNSKYFLDAVNAINDDNITIMLNSASAPFVIRPFEGDKYDFMILPIRIMAS